MGNQALVVTRGDIFNGMDGGGGVRWVQGLYHRGGGCWMWGIERRSRTDIRGRSGTDNLATINHKEGY